MLESLRAHCRALGSTEPAQLLELTGPLRDDSAAITALYAGNGANLEYLSAALFAAQPQRRTLETVLPPLIPRAVRRHEARADIVIVERPPLWSWAGSRIGEVRLPAWIRQELQLSTPSGRWQLGRHLEREAGRQIRRHDYRLVLSDAAEAKQVFFESFYRPYIESRHGSESITVGWQKFAAIAATASLAQLFAGSTWVAGMLLLWKRDTLRFGWFGSREDPPNRGASEVLDVLCIRMAADRGIRRIDFGSSRPSLSDGVVRYKKKFGATFVIPRYPQTQIELQIRKQQSRLGEWLNAHQFLCRVGDSLQIAGYRTGENGGLVFRPACDS